ncbi:unnamed protein product, partial [Penicillium discolor]
HRWLHAYDRGGSYLAGVSGCELGIGEPSYHPNGVTFDRKLPGYWKVNLPERAEWLVPNPLDPINRDQSIAGLESWVSTPTLELAIDLGLMASFEHHEGKPGFAPERYHAIQARARANILRRVKKIGDETGRWPVAITRDTVLYTSPQTDPDKAWPGDERNYGRGLGQFKYEGSANLQEHLPFLTGKGRYEGKSHLIELI